MRLEYLTQNDWALLRSRSRNISFDKGEIIIPVNSRPKALFILKKGSARVEVTPGKAIARLVAGDICGEMAFIENSVASATVLAETDSEADAFDLAEVSEVFSSYPHLEARFYKSVALLLSRRLRRTSSELARCISKS
jgi:CRP-like cAMP-binding protein